MFRNSYIVQIAAPEERKISDARYGVRNGYWSQAAALGERIISDARYTVRYRYRCQTVATIERSLSDARYTVQNNGWLTTYNKCIGSRFDNRVAVVARIVCGITTFNNYRCQAAAIS